MRAAGPTIRPWPRRSVRCTPTPKACGYSARSRRRRSYTPPGHGDSRTTRPIRVCAAPRPPAARTGPPPRPGPPPAGAGRWAGGRVLVLNATYEPINVCTVRRATVLLLKEKAELVEQSERRLRSTSTTLPRPVVIRLVTYVKVPRDTHRRKITRRAVFARDGWQCMYCGARSNLTVDHVIPRSKGGPSSWENIV